MSLSLRNNGNAAPGASSAKIYLSTDNVITTSDTLLTTQSIGALQPGGVYLNTNAPITIPGSLAIGTYWIGMIAHADNQNVESDETNNVSTPIAITVVRPNSAPVGNSDTYVVARNGTLTVAAKGVLANDTDSDHDPITAALSTNPGHGAVTLNADGSFVYTPTAGYTGTDSFTYKASDGVALSAATVVTISVTNSAPVAADDNYTVARNGTLTVAAKGVLTNDTEAENDTLTAALWTTPSHGSVTLNANGSFVYTPVTGYSGSDAFFYTASDGLLSSSVATVNLTVGANSAPVASNDTIRWRAMGHSQLLPKAFWRTTRTSIMTP